MRNEKRIQMGMKMHLVTAVKNPGGHGVLTVKCPFSLLTLQ